MSGLAQALVARGAGLPPTGGTVRLLPRPATRFEPRGGSAGGAPGEPDAGFVDERSGAAAPPGPRAIPPVGAVDPAAPKARRRAELQPPEMQHEPDLRAAQRPRYDGGAGPQRAVPDPDPDPPGGPLANISALAEPAREATAGAPEPPRARGHAPMRDPEPRPPADALGPATAAAEPAGDARPGQRSAPSPPDLAFEHTPAAPIAVSIGRVVIEFIEPRPSPAPPPRAQPERTRGFDAFARARRGVPR